jgi:hypothetical protein
MTRAGFMALCALVLPACVSVKLPPPQAVIENTVALRDSGIDKANVGNFTLAAGKDKGIDKAVTARGSPISVEGGGSFSGFLRQTLISDLTAASKYDSTATNVIEGELFENSLSAAGSRNASAMLVVRFVVKRNGETRYDKQVRQAAKWESSFVGAIAIPDAINHFSEQFRLILLQLYRDAEFLKALRPEAKVAISDGATHAVAPAT